MGPNGAENLHRQIAAKRFQTCPEFSSNGPHKTVLGIFEFFNFGLLMHFFFENFKFTFVPYGETNKRSMDLGARLDNCSWYNKWQFSTDFHNSSLLRIVLNFALTLTQDLTMLVSILDDCQHLNLSTLARD